MEGTANARGRTTRASAASDSHRKQGDASATASALTKPGAAGFQPNASPFSPYKNSPAPKPSPRNAPKPPESPNHSTSTPPPSSSTPAAPATASPAAATPQTAPAPSVASPVPANKHALGTNSSPRSQPTSGVAPQPAAPHVAAPVRAPAPQNTPQAHAKPPAPAAAAAKPPAPSPPKPVSPVASAVKQEEDPSSDDRSATQGSSQGKLGPGQLPNQQDRPPGYVHGNKDKNRSPYKCNKCGQPKKGHVCTSVLVPPFLQTGTSPMMKPNSPVGPTPVPQPKAPMPHGAMRAGVAVPHEPAFYANWFDMAVSSLDILRTSLVNNQDKFATWNELRACNAFVADAQTRIRQFRESLRQSEAQLKQRGIPVRVRGVDPSEAEAVEGLLRGLSEPRDAGAVPNVPKRMRSSDRGDETEPEEMARKAPKSSVPTSDPTSASSSGAGKTIATATSASASAPSSTSASAATSQPQSHEGTPRKRTLLATSDEDVPTGPVPVAKAARAASEPVARVTAKPSVPESVPQKEPAAASSSSEESDEQRQESPTPNTLAGAASQTLVSQPVQLSQPTASQTEQEIARMLQTPPGSQELAVMAPPAPKLVSPTKRSLLASDELLRPAPTLVLQGSSQPLSQVSDLDLEHAPDL